MLKLSVKKSKRDDNKSYLGYSWAQLEVLFCLFFVLESGQARSSLMRARAGTQERIWGTDDLPPEFLGFLVNLDFQIKF